MEPKEPKQFRDMLLAYSQQTDPEGRKQIENALWNEYGCEYAIFVLDMSSFSLLTRKFGIVHYLSTVRRMQLTASPVVTTYGGRVVKFEADNCYAVFPDPLSAVRSGIAMQLAFDAANLLTPEDLDIHIAIGIDYGRLLLVGQDDCFGDAMNRACKLGEDIAAGGEIMITQDAAAMIPTDAGIRTHAISVSISGMNIPTCIVDYRAK